MAGFREKFIHGIGKGTAVFSSPMLMKASGQKLLLPFYHAVSDNDMPHIKYLYEVKGIKAFVEDLDFLLKYYEPIDFLQLRDLIRDKKQPEKPSFLLSFDDGLKEFYEVIAPILLKKGIPAICFLNSGFIDNKGLFFRYKASLLADQIDKHPAIIKKIQPLLKGSGDIQQRLLSINYQNRELLNELAHLAGYHFDDFLRLHSPYLSSEQIRSLINQGFHFGAHSIDHPEYQTLDTDEQLHQTQESIQFICRRFSLDYKAFSFPFTDYGVSKRFFSKIKESNIAEVTFGCAGLKGDSIGNHFHRIPFEMGDLSGQQIHNSELLYYLLKMPFGKNIIIRND